MKKKVFSVLIALILVFSIAPLSAKAEPDNCDHSSWTEWTTTDSLPTTEGNYYLAKDVTLNGTWTVPGGTTNLCLNGHVIKGNNTFRIVSIKNGSTLNLYDCNKSNKYCFSEESNGLWKLSTEQTTHFVTGGCITGGYDACGGGVNIETGGKFTLHGGNIVGNQVATRSDSDGGGVYAAGDFIMYGGNIVGNNARHNAGGLYIHPNCGTGEMHGGTISNNTAAYIGGVTVNGTFTMSGGEISGNRTTDPNQGTGGGVCVINGKTFSMTGGKITGNTAHKTGAGVKADGTFIMTGGEISGNTALDVAGNGGGGGVYVEGSQGFTGSVTIGGTAKITGNKSGASGSEITNNVYLPAGKTISVGEGSDAPKNGMSVSISMQTAGRFASNGSSGDARFFKSDDSGNGIGYNTTNGYLELGSQYKPAPGPALTINSDYLEPLRNQLTNLINQGASGEVVVWEEGTALPYDIMQQIKNSDVTVEFKYTYEGVEYDVFINKSNVPNEYEEWYGPLYLAGLSRITGNAQLGDYIVAEGDTLNAIAAKYGTSVDEIMRKNPFIKDPNLIYPGQVLDL